MYNDIKLEKGLYGIAGKSFSDILCELDPDAAYADTDLAGLDAFERQLKRFDIRLSGKNSDMVEKFFLTAESGTLFPEYIARAVKQGMRDKSILGEMVAATTSITGYDYRSISSIPEEEDVSLKEVAEGAAIPTTAVKLNESLVKLTKRGRLLAVSYEAIRQQRLDLFTVTLKQIGAAIARAQVKDAISLIVDGGSGQPAAEVVPTAGAALTYGDLVDFWSRFEELDLTTLLVSPVTMSAILQFAELEDYRGAFMTTGVLKLPFGATLVKTTCLDDGTLIGLDKSCALEMISASDIQLESDKLIDRQLERAAITTVTGFSKIFAKASKVLSIGG